MTYVIMYDSLCVNEAMLFTVWMLPRKGQLGGGCLTYVVPCQQLLGYQYGNQSNFEFPLAAAQGQGWDDTFFRLVKKTKVEERKIKLPRNRERVKG